ncbi:MAG: hypothetical protein ACK4TP_18280 [Hyphomicrobium sp.]
MTERDQLEALKAEYRAKGFFVETDVPSSKTRLTIEGVRFLDLVAWASEGMEELPAIVVEIANRSRPRRGRRPSLTTEWADERSRLERFEAISRAIEKLRPLEKGDPAPVGLVIRFFDVTADQTRARRVADVNVRSAADIAAEIQRTRAMLAEVDKNKNLEIRALLYAREWARWLRLLGRRFPARRRALPEADLRTIQKELADRLILKTLSPEEYKPMHAAILAVAEGGDVEWAQLNRLGNFLKQLLDWAEAAMVADVRGPADTFEKAHARARRRQREE